MAAEIERKFLVSGSAWRQAAPRRIVQGYLNRDKQRTVRIRMDGTRGWLTIKGPSRGATRSEFEYAIPGVDARQLLTLCEGPLIEKLRHDVIVAGMHWEVDEFQGDNAGLVVAEIELEREDQAFQLPTWAGEEVTDDPRYFNANLVAHPFTVW